MSVNYFETLEVPEKLIIDAQDLEKRFYALSRKWHPDRFARASADEQQRALDASAVLNDAYRTLRQPVSRAEHLLTLKGIPPSEDKVPPELLEEVFELNLALEELQAGDTDSLPQLRDALKRFQDLLATADADLEADFRAWDESNAPAVLKLIRAHLNYRKYISNLVLETRTTLKNYVSD